jgi:hypothetical protein
MTQPKSIVVEALKEAQRFRIEQLGLISREIDKAIRIAEIEGRAITLLKDMTAPYAVEEYDRAIALLAEHTEAVK